MTERDIFLETIRLPDQVARGDFLDRACEDNLELRQRVEALIQAHERAGNFLEPIVPAQANTVDLPAGSSLTEEPGTVIGPYKLLQQIGEGGMGVVYMAEQSDPVRRKVALKIIKPGMDTREVIVRFEAERQALALMDHPNIARVFDGGATETGRPYFVMELVRGIPITDYCDQNHLPVHERLELFITVCHAVQHAHQKGIIHRDIKPSNVMVTLHDGRPVPKVIDFGVAKAISQQLTDKTLFTKFAQMVGTPLYMSPEQAQLTGLDVDTRGDIYSLGVLLYELLTGTTPFESVRMKQAAMEEIRRIIREDDPPSPSARLSSTVGETQTAVAAHRHIDPKGLRRLVRGDLDWIVMKALEKDRTRRYDTANSFAADIVRHLSDEPVEACPPSSGYRFQKFARRNQVAFTTAALVLAALVAGTFVSTWQAIRAMQAEQLAEMRLDSETRAKNKAVVAQTAADDARQEEAQQRKIAEQQRIVADQARDAMQTNLADVYTSHGVASGERNESAQAALWFAHAARLANKDPQRELANRVRARNWARAAGAVPVAALKHSSWLTRSLAFHPFEPYLLAVTTSNEGVLWNVRRDEQVPLPGGARSIASAAWHPDGRWLVLATPEGLVEIFSFPTGERLHQIPHGGQVRVVAFSGNGRYLAVGGHTARVWDCTTHEFATTELAHPQLVETLSFSSRGDRLVTGCRDNKARVFTVPGGDVEARPLFEPVPHVWNVTEEDHYGGGTKSAVFFDNDRALLTATGNSERSAIAGGDGFEASWWNATTGELIRRAPAPGRHGTLAVSPTDKHFVVSGLRASQLWDIAAARPLTPPLQHLNTVVTAAFSPDGRLLLTGGIDRIVRLWSVPEGKLLASRDVHADVSKVAFSPDGRLQAAAVNQGGVVFVWASVAGNSPMHQLPIDGSSLAKFSRDGRYVVPTGSLTKSAQMRTTGVFEVATGRRVSRAIDSGGLTLDAELSPDNRQLAILTSSARTASERDAAIVPGVKGNQAAFWDWQNDRRDFEPVPLPAEPRDLDYSPDGKALAVICGGGQLLVIDTATGRVTGEFQSQMTPPRVINMYRKLGQPNVRFSPDGKSLLAWGIDQEIHVLEVATGRPRYAPLNNPGGGTADLRFSSDGRLLATTGGVWEFASGRLAVTLPQHPDALFAVAFSPDGTQLLTGGRDGMARLWDWRSGRLLCPPLAHEHEVLDVAFTPDARWVVSTGIDGTVRLWDPHTGKPIAPPLHHGQNLQQLALTPDGTSLLAAPFAKAIPLFNLQDLTAHDALDLDELCTWGEILAHQKIYEGGGVENLSATDWLLRFRAFRERRFEFVQAPWSDAEQLAWHRDEAAACENQKQWSAALRHLDRLIAAEPQVSSHFSRRGEVYLNLKIWELARHDFSTVIEVNAALWTDWANRGTACLHLGQAEHAAGDFNQALELRSDQATLNNLAWLLATCPEVKLRDPKRAVELAKQAMGLTPNKGSQWNTLGVAQYRAGDWPATIAALTKSMELRNGGDAFDWYFLAMAHWQSDHKEDARKWFDQSVLWMEKNQPQNDELLRFHAEAAALLGVKDK